MFYFMDIFYALGLNIIKKVCVKYGQTDELEKKFCSFDEVVSLMQQAVKEPNHSGNYHDFIELCKLYDKNENGTIMLAELDNFLNLLGKFSNVCLFVTEATLECQDGLREEARSIPYKCVSYI